MTRHARKQYNLLSQLKKKSKTKTQFMARFINDSNIEIIKQQFKHNTVTNN